VGYQQHGTCKHYKHAVTSGLQRRMGCAQVLCFTFADTVGVSDEIRLGNAGSSAGGLKIA